MKVLMIGPSETRSKGGMAAVIRGIRCSARLSREFQIDSFPSYIDGSLMVRFLYSGYCVIKSMTCFISILQKRAVPSVKIFI